MDIKKGVSELVNLIGSEKVKSDIEFLESYSYDGTGIKSLPEIVVFPETESDVKNILEIAVKFSIPVTPRGSGVGYSGGSIPVKGGISLVFSKMNRILDFNENSLFITVEPGVITADIHKLCERRGFFYPPDPASLKISTIGGNVAENAGGPRCFKYGVTSDYVLSIEGFLITGERVVFGSKTIKDVAGYDVKKIVTGSEGTLIVMTAITLRIIPFPEQRVLIRTGFPSISGGVDFITKVIKKNVSPSVLEFMDKSSLKAVYDYLGIKDNNGINSVVLIELDGNKIDVDNKLKILKELQIGSEITEFNVANSESETEDLWSIRRNLSPAIAGIRPKKINEDIAVPIGMIPETIEYISGLSEKLEIPVIMFGHLGDGNIHTNIMIDPKDKNEVMNSKILLDKIFKFVVGLGGSITGEHGIGISKMEYLGYQYSNVEIDLFRKIKKVFDPDNLLNPGKIF